MYILFFLRHWGNLITFFFGKLIRPVFDELESLLFFAHKGIASSGWRYSNIDFLPSVVPPILLPPSLSFLSFQVCLIWLRRNFDTLPVVFISLLKNESRLFFHCVHFATLEI